jgi:hypothetical protein
MLAYFLGLGIMSIAVISSLFYISTSLNRTYFLGLGIMPIAAISRFYWSIAARMLAYFLGLGIMSIAVISSVCWSIAARMLAYFLLCVMPTAAISNLCHISTSLYLTCFLLPGTTFLSINFILTSIYMAFLLSSLAILVLTNMIFAIAPDHLKRLDSTSDICLLLLGRRCCFGHEFHKPWHDILLPNSLCCAAAFEQ